MNGRDNAPSRMEPLNLALRPFLNSRPVLRVSLLLWLLGVLLLLGNVSLFWSYLSSSADKRTQIARGEEEIQRQQRRGQQLQGRLDSIDLVKLNEQIDFLNDKIEARTFSWSLLVDRLVEVLPNDIRISRLSPKTGRDAERETRRSRTARGRDLADQVPLTITGETRSDEALMVFVDNLFAHPAFANPNLLREERQENNLVRFEVTVQYIPGGPPKGVVVEGAPRIEEAQPGSAPSKSTPPTLAGANPSGGQP
jgi:Tfp pilus assembly protein PilN